MTQLALQLSTLKRSWIDTAASVLVPKLPGLDVFTIDRLHGMVPEPEHTAWWGGLLARLKAEGRIEYVEHRPSARASANGRKVSAWRARR